jgi:cation diffusion facilitator family transporter
MTDISGQDKRLQKGLQTGITGIILNSFLALGKLIIGTSYGNVAIITDGVNNLTDAGTSVVAVTGFAISRKKPDKEHPAGYSRMEYICGLLISFLLCISAVSLLKSAVVHCTAGFCSGSGTFIPVSLLAVILGSSLVKLLLAGLAAAADAAVHSDLLKGIAADSLIDCGITAATVAAVFISPIVMLPLDSIICIPSAVYIGWTGGKIGLENIRKLL